MNYCKLFENLEYTPIEEITRDFNDYVSKDEELDMIQKAFNHIDDEAIFPELNKTDDKYGDMRDDNGSIRITRRKKTNIEEDIKERIAATASEIAMGKRDINKPIASEDKVPDFVKKKGHSLFEDKSNEDLEEELTKQLVEIAEDKFKDVPEDIDDEVDVNYLNSLRSKDEKIKYIGGLMGWSVEEIDDDRLDFIEAMIMMKSTSIIGQMYNQFDPSKLRVFHSEEEEEEYYMKTFEDMEDDDDEEETDENKVDDSELEIPPVVSKDVKNTQEDIEEDDEDEEKLDSKQNEINIVKEDEYINRYKSQLSFNARVINESTRKCNPILERLNFLAIAESNLTEFIQTKMGDLNKSKASRMVKHQTVVIEDTYYELMEELKEKYDVEILKPNKVKDVEEGKYYDRLKEWYDEYLCFVQPMRLKESLPYPDLAHDQMVIIAKGIVRNSLFTWMLKVPTDHYDRLVPIPGMKNKFVLLEDLLMEFSYTKFGCKPNTQYLLRILRKASSLKYENVRLNRNTYLDTINNGVKLRARNPIVMSYCNRGDSDTIKKVIRESERDNDGLSEEVPETRKRKIIGGVSYVKDFIKLVKLKGKDEKQAKFKKTENRVPEGFPDVQSLFERISKNDVLVHFPYESFDLSTARFLREAAMDENVKSIKQTLYRVGGMNSSIMEALLLARSNNKDVTILVELKAKFDEANNIKCLDRLKRAGANIIFGLENVKTHAKVIMVDRIEEGKIRHYVNISTGNFNDKTSSIYEDYSLFTKNKKIARDCNILFEYLGNNNDIDRLYHLVISQVNMKSKFTELIDKCKVHPTHSRIILKMNGLTDREMIRKLYDASTAGVKIDIICRGMCCLRPGIPGLSENITVKSVVGRFLEHSRIFKFEYVVKFNEETKEPIVEDEIFIGSADWMERNLNNRVEVVVPILDKEIKKQLNRDVRSYLKDNVNSYVLQQNGIYVIPKFDRYSDDKEAFDVQSKYIKRHKNIEDMIISNA